MGVAGVAMACALAIGAGCANIDLSSQSTDSSSSSSKLRAMRNAQITDLPVPEGFTIKDSHSEDYTTPGWRFVRYTYEGSSHTRAVLNFYREQMPLNGWNYISRQSRNGRYTLRFEKPNEVCEVVIESISGAFGQSSGSQLAVEIKPLRRSGQMKGEDSVE